MDRISYIKRQETTMILSTPDNRLRRMVMVGAGSFLRTTQVDYEDEGIWVFPFVEFDEDSQRQEVNNYAIMDKRTADYYLVDEEEYKRIKRERKNR